MALDGAAPIAAGAVRVEEADQIRGENLEEVPVLGGGTAAGEIPARGLSVADEVGAMFPAHAMIYDLLPVC